MVNINKINILVINRYGHDLKINFSWVILILILIYFSHGDLNLEYHFTKDHFTFET